MKKFKYVLITCLSVALLIVSGLLLSTLSSQAVAQSSCQDNRCDFRDGSSYGCILYAPDKECAYTGGTCTGWAPCDDGPTDPEDNI